MTTATLPPPTAAPKPGRIVPATFWASPSIYRFSVEQYQRMTEAGILTKNDRVELLEGYVVYKMPRNPPHDGTIGVMDEVLRAAVPGGWYLRCQLTVALAESQPEPDFAIARGSARVYLSRHPAAADVGLVVEVADSTLDRDQAEKGRIYARAGAPVYWIINLVDRQVEVYTQPSGPADAPAYGSLVAYAPGDDVPLVLDGATVATIPAADLLP